jgi:hypothetical protein
MYVGNVALRINLPLAGLFARLLTIPQHYLDATDRDPAFHRDLYDRRQSA